MILFRLLCLRKQTGLSTKQIFLIFHEEEIKPHCAKEITAQ